VKYASFSEFNLTALVTKNDSCTTEERALRAFVKTDIKM
jgi:hypothetical protein